MAIAVDAVTNGTGGTVTSITYSHTCSGENRYLLVFVRGGGGEGNRVTGITYNGVAMSLIGVANYGEAMIVYGLVNPATGAHNVVVSFSSSSYAQSGCISYTGVHQTSSIDGTVQTYAPTSVSSVTATVTTSYPGSWLIIGAKNGSLTISAGTNCTLRVNCGSEGARSGDTNGGTTPGANTIQVTASGSSNWSVVGLALRPTDPISGGGIYLFGGGVTIE